MWKDSCSCLSDHVAVISLKMDSKKRAALLQRCAVPLPWTPGRAWRVGLTCPPILLLGEGSRSEPYKVQRSKLCVSLPLPTLPRRCANGNAGTKAIHCDLKHP